MPRRTSEDPNSGHWLTFLMESRVVSNAWRSRCVKMWYPPQMATGSRRSSVSSLASFSERHSTANGKNEAEATRRELQLHLKSGEIIDNIIRGYVLQAP